MRGSGRDVIKVYFGMCPVGLRKSMKKLSISGVPVDIRTKHLSNLFKALLTDQPIQSHPVNLTESLLVKVIYRNGSLHHTEKQTS